MQKHFALLMLSMSLFSGKTTVAKLYGEVLRDLGLLSRGKVVVKTPADFIGDVIGLSEKKTLAILKETEGCVLVIDEAYGLYPGKRTQDPFKASCPMFFIHTTFHDKLSPIVNSK